MGYGSHRSVVVQRSWQVEENDVKVLLSHHLSCRLDGILRAALHDGVRPLINEKLISDNIKKVREQGSAITVTPAIETIVSTDNRDEITKITDRKQCFLARAPQSFILQELVDAHHKAIAEGIHDMIDSASLMKHYGHTLFTVDGPVENIKITTPADFYTFRALYDARENQQIFGL